MSNVKLEIGDSVMLKGDAFLYMSEERYMSLVKRTYNRQQKVLFTIVNIVDDIATVELFSKSKNIKYFEVPMKCLRYVPNVGQIVKIDYCEDEAIVKSVDLDNKSVVVDLPNSNDGRLKIVKLTKINKFYRPEIKETPFEESFVILNHDLHCKISKIGWDPKDGNILSVLDYCNNRCLFGGSISEMKFMDEKPIFLTELGETIIYTLLQNHKSRSSKIVKGITDPNIGLYDLHLHESGTFGLMVVMYKRFKNHGTNFYDGSNSLRMFCEDFSDYMIRK